MGNIKDIIENAPKGAQYYNEGVDAYYREYASNVVYRYVPETREWTPSAHMSCGSMIPLDLEEGVGIKPETVGYMQTDRNGKSYRGRSILNKAELTATAKRDFKNYGVKSRFYPVYA